MPKTTIFVGSSGAAKSQAKAVIKAFKSATLDFVPWWDAFTAGRTLLEDLDNIRKKVDGAVLLFSPESRTTIRKKKYEMPNLNVLFEFGYFYGHFGKEKVAMLKYGISICRAILVATSTSMAALSFDVAPLCRWASELRRSSPHGCPSFEP